jgi:hypothetical protein
MRKSKFIKTAVSSFLVLMALWVATPKFYIHSLLHHSHAVLTIDSETKVQSQSADDDCDFDEYNKPVYFGIFKFIGNLIPLKPQNLISNFSKSLKFSTISFAISLLRGPPVSQ